MPTAVAAFKFNGSRGITFQPTSQPRQSCNTFLQSEQVAIEVERAIRFIRAERGS
jgi:hypothetical protein